MMNRSLSRGLDAARLGACFMVVLLHSASLETYVLGNTSWAKPVYDALSRSAVPLFLMISGALLLYRQEPLPTFLRKRLLRVLPPLLLWSLIYMAWNSWHGESYGPPLRWLWLIVSGPVVFHLWYLYAIVGIYLFVPYLRYLWQASGSLEKNVFLLLWLVVSAWPIVGQALGIQADLIDTWQLGSFFGYFGYLFLGAYLRQWAEPAFVVGTISWRGMAVAVTLFMVFSLLTLVLTGWHSQQQGQFSLLLFDYLSPLVVGASVCAGYVLCCLGARAHRFERLLKCLAGCTLGVYCLHVLVLGVVGHITRWQVSQNALAWLTIPVTAIVVFLISLGLVLVLRCFRVSRYLS